MPNAETATTRASAPLPPAAPMPQAAPLPPEEPGAAHLTGITELNSAEELRELLGTPHPIVIDKVKPHLDEQEAAMLAASPFCVLSTSDAAGNCDASPRGGDPGFVHALDSRTLVLPDRPGNRRADSFQNILQNPQVGLVHLVPGSTNVLRVNGRARILTDAPFFDTLTVKGQRPTLALLIHIEEAYRHCPASLRRANLWSS